MKQMQAHFLPALTTPDELAGGVVVVIDVLRATTVIAHALAAGARSVIPCLEIDEARSVAQGFPPGEAVLGGERGGLPIEGFDLGNSPSEYRPETVSGKTVVFTTTNGTKAMRHCRQAKRVLLGAFVNASAVAAAIANEGRVRLVCAGTRGEITREDVLLAGCLADKVSHANSMDKESGACEINDQWRIARDAWRAQRLPEPATDWLSSLLRRTQGGRNLIRIGLDADIVDAARLDRFAHVPELHTREWKITLV